MDNKAKQDKSTSKLTHSINKLESPKPSPIDKKPKKQQSKLYPIWKQSSLVLKADTKKISNSITTKQNTLKTASILPLINKDRPYSENNVTHQIDDFHSLVKEKFMASISHNRELSTLRKKINAIQSHNSLFTDEFKSVKDLNKLEFLPKPVLDPIQNNILSTEKKSYVDKFRGDLQEAKKFNNPALHEKIELKTNNEKVENSIANVSSEEIKDEINITMNSSEKSMSKNVNEFKRISEKTSQKSSSYEKSSSSYSKKEKKILLYNKSNQSSSNSEELLENQKKLRKKAEKGKENLFTSSCEEKKFNTNEFSNENFNAFKSEIYGSIIKWKLGDLIDCGSFSQVFRAMDCDTGKIFAVKKFNLNGPGTMVGNSLQEIEAELEILKKIKHENIVKYHGHEKINGNFYIYLEYISGGNISSILAKYGPLTEATIKLYAKQLLSGLDYLHENKIIHKDIKGANILVETNGVVKLSDFGCSIFIEKTLTLYLQENKDNGIQGSIPWMAPEVIRQTKYGRKSDIWSFGCTILEMITGKPPWFGYNFDNSVAAIMKIGCSNEIPAIPENISTNLKDFLLECLQRDPENRSSVKNLLSHQFLLG